jgi:hypothetical protein
VQCLSASAASCANPDLGDGQADEDEQNRGLGHGSSFIGHPQAPGEVVVGAVVMLLAVRRLRPRLTR